VVTTAGQPKPHAVIIGSGFGGLAAAIRLGARGYRVTLLEQLDKPGGRAYVFEQDGFRFDAGPTIITAPYLFEELWSLCGKRMADHVDLRPCDPFYNIRFDDGSVFCYRADHQSMCEEVARFDPDAVQGYERFLKVSKQIYDVAFAQLADEPFHKLSMLMRTAFQMVRLRGYRSVYQRVCEFFTHPKLRIVFSFHPLLIGGNPLTANSYYCLIAHLESKHGVHYAMGGMGAMVKGLTDLITGQGNEIRCNAKVTEIVSQHGRATGVRLESGETLPADIVVSNADPAWTYGKLLRDYPRRRWHDRKLRRASYSMSVFLWYFGTRRRYDDVAHHTMVLGPRYRGLLNDIFRRKVLAEDFSIYLYRPTATDPSMAPEGCDTFYALAPVPNLSSGTDWTRHAEPYRQAVQQRLSETLLPGLEHEVVTSRLMTPLDFRDRLLSVEGAAFAMEPQLRQSAWFRPHNVSEELQGLYLVGAGTHPGAGLPGVVSSARIVDKLVPDPKTRIAVAR
jgi:phytoene desaturase